MSKQDRTIGYDHHDGFPRLVVVILVLCVSVNSYTLANLFPYVGIMVRQLMGLESINDSGEATLTSVRLEMIYLNQLVAEDES